MIYIILVGILALLIALFQYVHKSKLNSRLRNSLFVLRFLTLFAIGLLIINPKFNSFQYYNEKPNLILAVDNSESVSYLDKSDDAISTLNSIISNDEINNRFNLETYAFGKELFKLDSLEFNENQSNINNTLKQLEEVYGDKNSPIVLITDGNQTYGMDYSYAAREMDQSIYPIILGDSILYSDLSIKQLNVNRYAFLKNRFPVEIIVTYSGKQPVESELKIWSGNRLLFKKSVSFDELKSSEIVSTTLLANSVGLKTFKAEIVALEDEKNKINNIKNFGVEVIDQKTNIALIYERMHPDLGALKKSIESNEQRKVTILSPQEYISQSDDFQLVILYQPDNNFEPLLNRLEDDNISTLTITGATTNWDLLNTSQDNYKQAITNQVENYQPRLNENFGNFIIEDIDFSDFPPLKSEFGDFGINVPHDVVMFKTVSGISTKTPLLATYEVSGLKNAILNGEGIWRWRAQSYLNTKSFEGFDNFINKLVQYLSSNKRRNRLNVDYQTFYNGNEDIIITAQYFNKSFEFDRNAALTLNLDSDDNMIKRELPLLLTNRNYKVDLSGLEAGVYNFSIKHNSESVSISGSFEVLDYNVEQQFLNADIEKLKKVAINSNGEAFYSFQTEELINNLLADNRYVTIQKSSKNIVPLIDWKYLLAFIAISLFLEWIIRKYNGLI